MAQLAEGSIQIEAAPGDDFVRHPSLKLRQKE
jgi:hypothetical protein